MNFTFALKFIPSSGDLFLWLSLTVDFLACSSFESFILAVICWRHSSVFLVSRFSWALQVVKEMKPCDYRPLKHLIEWRLFASLSWMWILNLNTGVVSNVLIIYCSVDDGWKSLFRPRGSPGQILSWFLGGDAC